MRSSAAQHAQPLASEPVPPSTRRGNETAAGRGSSAALTSSIRESQSSTGAPISTSTVAPFRYATLPGRGIPAGRVRIPIDTHGFRVDPEPKLNVYLPAAWSATSRSGEAGKASGPCVLGEIATRHAVEVIGPVPEGLLHLIIAGAQERRGCLALPRGALDGEAAHAQQRPRRAASRRRSPCRPPRGAVTETAAGGVERRATSSMRESRPVLRAGAPIS